MFDDVGMGELLVILVAVIFFVDPKKLGKVMREIGKYRRKFTQFQSQIKSQFDALALEVENAETQEKLNADKGAMRRWAREKVQALPALERAEAAQAIVKSLADWPSYKSAKVVSCFAGALDEIDTLPLLRRILADGKTLLVPFVRDETGAAPAAASTAEASEAPATATGALATAGATAAKTQSLGMAAIANPDKDLEEGAFHILEPRAELRGPESQKPDLILVPGLCFDQRGGRIGKGLGFYDKYLADVKGLRLGVCFDVQITQKNLALDPHDQVMDALVSEKRFIVFSAPKPTAVRA